MLESKPDESGFDARNIVAVIVLYKVQAREATAFVTLDAATAGLSKERSRIHVLLYDNTRTAEIRDSCLKGCNMRQPGEMQGCRRHTTGRSKWPSFTAALGSYCWIRIRLCRRIF